MSERVPPSGFRYELAYFRGWIAWIVVMYLWPERWIMTLPGRVLGWACFYASDDRHSPKETDLA